MRQGPCSPHPASHDYMWFCVDNLENDGVTCVIGWDNLENDGVTFVFGTCSYEVWRGGYTRPGAFLLLQPFLLLRCLEYCWKSWNLKMEYILGNTRAENPDDPSKQILNILNIVSVRSVLKTKTTIMPGVRQLRHMRA